MFATDQNSSSAEEEEQSSPCSVDATVDLGQKKPEPSPSRTNSSDSQNLKSEKGHDSPTSGGVGSSSSAQLQCDTLTDPPTLVIADTNSASITWNAITVTVPPEILSSLQYTIDYDLQMQETISDPSGQTPPTISNDNWSIQYHGPANYVLVRGLKPGRQYAARVVPCITINNNINKNNIDNPHSSTPPSPPMTPECLPSPLLTINLLPTHPSNPPPPLLAARSRHSLKLKWEEPEDDGGSPIQDYVLGMRPAPEDWLSPPNEVGYYEIYRGTTQKFLQKKLLSGQQYMCAVKAVNSVGDSPWSVGAAFCTQASPPSQPSPPQIVQSGKDSVTLQWRTPPDNGSSIQYYVLEKDDGYNGDFTFVYRGKETVVTVTGLTAGLPFRFRVRAENEVGPGECRCPCTAYTQSGAPSAPHPPTKLGCTHTTIVLSWNEPPETSSLQSPLLMYEIEIQPKSETAQRHWPPGLLQRGSNNKEQSWSIGYRGVEKSCTLNHLYPGCVYKCRVLGISSWGRGEPSFVTEVSTAPDIPEQPEPPIIVSRDHTALTLAWKYPSHDGGIPVSKYLVEVRLAPTHGAGEEEDGEEEGGDMHENGHGNGWENGKRNSRGECSITDTSSNDMVVATGRGKTTRSVVVREFPGSDLKGEVVDLKPGSKYLIRLAAANKLGPSIWSRVITADTKPGLPPAPHRPKVTSSGPCSLHLEWDDLKGHGFAQVTSYIVQMTEQAEDAPDGAFKTVFQGSPLDSNKLNNKKCIIKDLTPHTAYFFRLKACNSVGEGAWSPVVKSITEPVPPTPPQQLKALQLGKTSVNLSWSPPADDFGVPVSKYDVEIGKGRTTPMSSSSLGWRSVYQGSDAHCEIKNLTPGSQYSIRVRAANACGWGSWTGTGTSDLLTIKTEPDTPGPPSKVAFTNRTATGVKLKWSPPAEDNGSLVASYQVYRSLSSSTSSCFELIATTDAPICKVSGLSPGTSYTFKVRAVNAVGPGPYGEESRVTTSLAPPPPPTDITVSEAGTSGSLIVEWWPVVVTGGGGGEGGSLIGSSHLVSACTGYEVEASPVHGTTTTTTTCSSGDAAVVVKQSCGRKATSCRLTGLNPNVSEYSVRMRSVGADGAGHGAWSDAVKVKTGSSSGGGGGGGGGSSNSGSNSGSSLSLQVAAGLDGTGGKQFDYSENSGENKLKSKQKKKSRDRDIAITTTTTTKPSISSTAISTAAAKTTAATATVPSTVATTIGRKKHASGDSVLMAVKSSAAKPRPKKRRGMGVVAKMVGLPVAKLTMLLAIVIGLVGVVVMYMFIN